MIEVLGLSMSEDMDQWLYRTDVERNSFLRIWKRRVEKKRLQGVFGVHVCTPFVMSRPLQNLKGHFAQDRGRKIL